MNRLKEKAASLFHFYLFGNFHISVCAAALTAATRSVFGLTPSFSFCAFAFFGTLFIYNLQRFLENDPKKQGGINSVRHLWLRAHSDKIAVVTIMAALGSGVVYALGLFEILPAKTLLLPCLIAFSYAVPVIPSGRKWMRLRDLPSLKIFLIAVTWAFITAYLPVADIISSANENFYFGSHGYLWTLSVLLFILAITIPFDIRDLEKDDPQLKSLPMMLGVRRAKMAGVAVTLLAALTGSAFLIMNAHSVRSTIAFILSMAVCIPLILKADVKRSEYYFAFFTDGTILLLWLLLFAANFIK